MEPKDLDYDPRLAPVLIRINPVHSTPSVVATTETASVMATTSTEQHLAHDQHM